MRSWISATIAKNGKFCLSKTYNQKKDGTQAIKGTVGILARISQIPSENPRSVGSANWKRHSNYSNIHLAFWVEAMIVIKPINMTSVSSLQRLTSVEGLYSDGEGRASGDHTKRKDEQN